MKPDITRRLIKGVSAKGFGAAVQIIVRLGEVPLFLHFWGAELYGEWLILIALPSYLSMSDFGFAGATNRHMAMLVAKGERDTALSAFQSSSLLIAGLSTSLAALFVAVLWLLPTRDLFQVAAIGDARFMIVIVLLSLQMVVSSQVQLLFSGFYAEKRYPLGFIILGLINLGGFAALAIAIFWGAGPIGAAAAMLAAQIIGFGTMWLGLRHAAPWVHYGLRHASREMIRLLARPAIANMAFPLGQALNYQGVRLVVGALLGPVAVVVLVTHRQLARLVNLVGSIAAPFLAELSALFGADDMMAFRALARRTVQIVLWAMFGIVLGLLVVAEPVFIRWTGGEVEYSTLLFLLLVAASAMETVWWAAMAPLLATNHHIGIAKLYAVTSAALLLPIYAATSVLGLDAVAIVLIAAEMVLVWRVIHNVLALTNDEFRNWFLAVVIPPTYLFQYIGRR